MKTVKELEAEIEIHQKAGATLKVKQLQDRIAKINAPQEEDPEPETEAPDESIALLDSYEMWTKGFSWTEITEKTGIKSPWIRVKKFAKDNNLPYERG